MRGMKNPSKPSRGLDRSLADDARRRHELGRFLPLWPDELNDLTACGRERVIRLLSRALRHERRRGQAGHQAYDLARHAALLRIYKAEVRAGSGATKSLRQCGTKGENSRPQHPPGLVSTPIAPHIPNDIVRRPSYADGCDRRMRSTTTIGDGPWRRPERNQAADRRS